VSILRRWTGRPKELRNALVMPARAAVREVDLSNVARALVRRVRALAGAAFEGEIDLVAVDLRARRAWRLPDGGVLSDRELRSRYRVYFNASFLACEDPPVAELQAASRLVCCGSMASGDLFAIAPGARRLKAAVLWSWLHALAGDDADVPDWRENSRVTVPPGRSHPDCSPSMRGVTLARGRSLPEAPRYLNTAWSELLAWPKDGTAEESTRETARAFASLRDESRVPWIWNALLNEVEYRSGTSEPIGLPPEVHLSLTGVCNIECHFCGYAHETARFNRVTLEQTQKLSFLARVRVLRLNSGLGEPTANGHLAAIVRWVSDRFPHLSTNFFTNGINLQGPALLDAIVGRVRWISVSLNAARADTWREVCEADFFDRVLRNLRELHAAKRAAATPYPIVCGTMVLQGANLEDLPRMPALCRSLGVDRFTGFPYFGLGFKSPLKYGPDLSLASVRDRYEALYDETMREAQAHEVSIELPLPETQKSVSFGLERRGFHDFARIETNDWPLARFLEDLTPMPARPTCHFLWRQAAIGSTLRGQSPDETHYLYPCLGPLSSVDLSRDTAFRFDEADAFDALWRNPVFTLLRRGQLQEGLSPVCDACRATDTRDPAHASRLAGLVGDFTTAHVRR
jgi:molybdenum cofactor biosynthesis enzyme MoaA